MPGNFNMFIGGLAFIAGLTLTAISWIVAPGGYYVVAYGAIGFGAIQFLIGLSQLIWNKVSHTPRSTEGNRAEASGKAILQAMLATCIADGDVQDDEVKAIATIAKQLLGMEVNSETIKNTARSMLSNKFDIGMALTGSQSMILPSEKPLILKAAYLVAASDGEIDQNERDILTIVGISLGMTMDEIVCALNELNESKA